MSITIDLPDDCEGDVLYLFCVQPSSEPKHIPGWNFYSDVPVLSTVLGETITHRAYWRLVPTTGDPHDKV